MSALNNYVSTRQNTSVTTSLDNRQIQNNTGGFVYEIDDKSRLERFLILGTDGGTYYVSEQDLTAQNVSWLEKLIQRSPDLILDVIFDVSTNGRAYRNTAAIFVLAMILNHGDDEAKARAVAITPQIARTATMVYDLAKFIDGLGGWGRAKRRAVASWFTTKTPDQLSYQAVKYRQRNGWTLRDLMRLSHPVGVDPIVGNFILGKSKNEIDRFPTLHGFTQMQSAATVQDVVRLLNQTPNLPWEAIPTQFLKEADVWKTLFYNGSLSGQALLRNVIRLSRIGAFNDLQFAGDYAKKLTDSEMISKTLLHPVQYLLASVTYDRGQMDRTGYSSQRRKDWTTNAKIKGALDDGFYQSFKNVEPSGKRIRIGVDVSSSMSWGSAVGADVTAAEGAAAMAMVLARTEEYVEILGFAHTLKDLQISSRDSLSEVLRKTRDMNFGWTNPSLLIDKAGSKIDAFIVITDNEVNSGNHPSLSLKRYRQQTGLDSKLVVMGMTATNFSIADPTDRGMLDVCGFDSNVPKVVTDFMKGKI